MPLPDFGDEGDTRRKPVELSRQLLPVDIALTDLDALAIDTDRIHQVQMLGMGRE